jgi:hypothetical protein
MRKEERIVLSILRLGREGKLVNILRHFLASNYLSQVEVTTLRKVMIASLRTGQGVYQEQKGRGKLSGMRRRKHGEIFKSIIW